MKAQPSNIKNGKFLYQLVCCGEYSTIYVSSSFHSFITSFGSKLPQIVHQRAIKNKVTDTHNEAQIVRKLSVCQMVVSAESVVNKGLEAGQLMRVIACMAFIIRRLVVLRGVAIIKLVQ